jgi:serine/threonine-protein kinase/endoribonuclease IRE1
VTELCVGSLVDLVRGNCKDITINGGAETIRQIAKGLQHLHLLDIIHGDLKPSNIMVTSSKGALKASLKLTDFGLRHIVGDLSNNEFCVSCSDFRAAFTEDWMAPEPDLTMAFDIFALGLVSGFALSSGCHVYGTKPKERIARIKSQKPITLTVAQLINVTNPEEALQFILSMLRFEPHHRPSASDVLMHKFFRPKAPSLSSLTKGL